MEQYKDKELMEKLYTEHQSAHKIAKVLNVGSTTIYRWLKKHGIDAVGTSKKYSINETYFKNINSSVKAYWLGFIWGDGYVMKRVRNGTTSYELKIGLSETDRCQLELFKRDVESTHEIKTYDIKSGFGNGYKETRFYISNKDFVMPLYEKYGIIPGRDDFSKVLENVPEEYHKDLLRGLIDSDGCITMKDLQYAKLRKEFQMSLIANESVLDFFNNLIIKEGFTTTEYARNKRHEGADGKVRSIQITGNKIVSNILNWLYENKKENSLSRKYQRYEFIRDYMKDYEEENWHDKRKIIK